MENKKGKLMIGIFLALAILFISVASGQTTTATIPYYYGDTEEIAPIQQENNPSNPLY